MAWKRENRTGHSGKTLASPRDDGLDELLQRRASLKANTGPVTTSFVTWVTLVNVHEMIMDSCHDEPERLHDSLGALDQLDHSIIEYIEGFHVYRDGDLDEAVRLFDLALAHAPWNALARFTMGNVFYLQSRYDLALSTFKDTLPSVDGDARSEVLTNAGMCAFKLDRIDDARQMFMEAIESNPRNAYAHNNIGIIHEQEGRETGARTAYITSIAINPLDAETWYNLGTLDGKQGNKESRLFCFIKAEEQGMNELADLIQDLLDQDIKPRDPRLGS